MSENEITEMNPAEIDSALSEIYGSLGEVDAEIATLLRRINSLQKTFTDAYVTPYMEESAREGIESAHTQISVLKFEREMLTNDLTPFEDEFVRRGGWSRFFSVMGGHIHSSMNCGTCNKMGKPTSFRWLPEWSGRSESEALASLTENHKTILCSVCFPDAPVELYRERQDPNSCPGSGKSYDENQPYSIRTVSKWGTCPVCKKRVGASPLGKLRKHPK